MLMFTMFSIIIIVYYHIHQLVSTVASCAACSLVQKNFFAGISNRSKTGRQTGVRPKIIVPNSLPGICLGGLIYISKPFTNFRFTVVCTYMAIKSLLPVFHVRIQICVCLTGPNCKHLLELQTSHCDSIHENTIHFFKTLGKVYRYKTFN